MNGILTFYIILGSVVSMTGTVIGALLGVLVRKPTKRLLGVINGFAGGIMLSVVVFDLIPEAINHWSMTGTLLFCIAGMAVVAIADLKINVGSAHTRIALITAAGLMIHNFPEGIIMGIGFASGTTLGVKMAIIMGIHDIPEGIAVCAPLMVSNIRKHKILIYALVTALPTVAGALVGGVISNISSGFMGACLSLASGIMLYVVCGELLPESTRLWDGISSTFGVLTGVILGLVITNIL